MQGIVDILTRFVLAGCGVVAAAVMLTAGLVAQPDEAWSYRKIYVGHA